MKDRNLPPDNSSDDIEDLTIEANSIIESLEKEKNLQNSIETYNQLLKLNNIIHKKFQKDAKKISEDTKKKINDISSKKHEK
jgi:hypothetical protein|tara:strand:+ start:362 stop:607 length:246 start_codon:yes stop_codon:yes gene_type:complete